MDAMTEPVEDVLDLPVTQRRREALEHVRGGRVTYSSLNAQYLFDGEEPLRNWDFRTLAELRRGGLIELARVGAGEPAYRPVLVVLTDRGVEISGG
jgi:hypothetical protein